MKGTPAKTTEPAEAPKKLCAIWVKVDHTDNGVLLLVPDTVHVLRRFVRLWKHVPSLDLMEAIRLGDGPRPKIGETVIAMLHMEDHYDMTAYFVELTEEGNLSRLREGEEETLACACRLAFGGVTDLAWLGAEMSEQEVRTRLRSMRN